MKKHRGKLIDKREIELTTFNAKHTLDERRYEINEWKRQISHDIPRPDDETLITSIAYVNDVNSVLPIYRAKSRDNPTAYPQGGNEADLNDAKEALKRTKRELQGKSHPNLCTILRDMSSKDIAVSFIKMKLFLTILTNIFSVPIVYSTVKFYICYRIYRPMT